MVSGAEMVEKPNVDYDSVGGLDEEIYKLEKRLSYHLIALNYLEK